MESKNIIQNENSSNQIKNVKKEEDDELIGNCLDDFEFLKILGEGSFGWVFKIKSKKNKKLYALKKIKFQNEIKWEKNKKEMILLKYLNHENICKCFRDFKTMDGTQYMVMKYYDNKDLYKYVEANIGMNHHIREEIIWNIIFQCLEGLSYLHLQGIIHCDIKLGNILMTEEGKIVIGDFGESMVKDNIILQRITKNKEEQNILRYKKCTRGTTGYIAPEVKMNGCDEKTDVYSLGICFYALLYFTFPDKNMDFNFSQNNYSKELKQLIKGMIAIDPKKRKDLADVKKEFSKFYYQRYVKNSGFHSLTQCLLNFSNLRNIISTNSSIIERKETNEKKINVSLILISIFTNTDIEINNYYLKRFFSEQFQKELKDNEDISPLKVIFFLINSLNNDLNEVKNTENSEIQKVLNRKIKFSEKTNIENLYNQFKNAYKEHFKSVISTDCLGVLKVMWTCLNCNTNYISFEKFFSITFNINDIKDSKINILDLFHKYNQKKFEIGIKKFVKCENCKKFTNHSMNKKFYNIPNNLIIMFHREKNKNTEIELQKEIKFNNSVIESFSQVNINYILVGIIYENENMNENSQYVPIINENKKWYQFKYGQQKELVDLDAINKNISKNVVALFYYKDNPIDNMFSSEPPEKEIININLEEIKTIIVLNKKGQDNSKNNHFLNNINKGNNEINNQINTPNNIQDNIRYTNNNNQNYNNQNSNNNNLNNFENNNNKNNYSNEDDKLNNNINNNNKMNYNINQLNNQLNNLNFNNNMNNCKEIRMNNNQIMNMNNNIINNLNNSVNISSNIQKNFINNNMDNIPNMNQNNIIMNNNQYYNQINNNIQVQNINYSPNIINLGNNQNNNMSINQNNMNYFQNNNYNQNQNNETNKLNKNYFTTVNNIRNNFSFFKNDNNINANNNCMGMGNNINNINIVNPINNNNYMNMNNLTTINPNINFINQRISNQNNIQPQMLFPNNINNLNNIPFQISNYMMNVNCMNIINNNNMNNLI